MKFFDLHIKSNLSNGEHSIEDIASFAEKLGYSGIAICDNYVNVEKLKELKKKISELKSNLEIYPGVYIEAKDPGELNSILNKVRDEVTIVVVHGGDYNINRAACENSKVDILSHPEYNRADNGLDEAAVKAATENNVAIEINFNEVLFSYRKQRTYILNNIAKNIKLCDAFRTPMIICSAAKSIWEMRDPRQLISVATILGMDLGKAFSAISTIPQTIVENNKKILEGKSPTSGVEVV